jgi:hypothetical protein
MKEYRFEAPVVLGFTIRAESEIEARKIAVDLAIGKIDYASVPDATLGGRPPHLINLIAVFDPSRQPSTTIVRPLRPR